MSEMKIMKKKMMERKEIEKEPIFKEHEKLKMALVVAITLGLAYFVMSTILRVPI
jgi:hypothetical protein